MFAEETQSIILGLLSHICIVQDNKHILCLQHLPDTKLGSDGTELLQSNPCSIVVHVFTCCVP